MNTQRMASLADVLAPSTTQQSDVIYEQEKPSLPSSSSSLAVMDVDSWLDIGIHEQSSRDLVLWPMRDEMDQLEVNSNLPTFLKI